MEEMISLPYMRDLALLIEGKGRGKEMEVLEVPPAEPPATRVERGWPAQLRSLVQLGEAQEFEFLTRPQGMLLPGHFHPFPRKIQPQRLSPNLLSVLSQSADWSPSIEEAEVPALV